MNERIKEIAIRACKWASENAPLSEYENACDEKFAELIIEECASICYNSHIEYGDVHAQNILYEFNIDNCRNNK